MPIYEYKCKDCGLIIEAPERWLKLHGDIIPPGECDGQLVRIWSVNLHRENIRAVPRG